MIIADADFPKEDVVELVDRCQPADIRERKPRCTFQQCPTHAARLEWCASKRCNFGERGRLMLPAAVRRELELEAGEPLLAILKPDKSIQLRRPRDEAGRALAVVRVGDRGRLVLPAWLRAELKLEAGDRLLADVQRGGSLRLRPFSAIARGVVGLWRGDAPPGVSMVDQLIAERRAEAAREAASEQTAADAA